jgi:transcriptional regulator with XRE-family HTH domain
LEVNLPDRPDPIDVHVGQRLRLRRNLLGMSQQKLGDAVGLTFQQIQKYERGANRMGASRLYQFGRLLEVPVSFFFEDIPRDLESGYHVQPSGMSDMPQAKFEAALDRLTERTTISLVQAFYAIENNLVRRKVLEMVRAIGFGESIEDELM